MLRIDSSAVKFGRIIGIELLKNKHSGKSIAVLGSSPTISLYRGEEDVSIAVNGSVLCDSVREADYFLCGDRRSHKRSWFELSFKIALSKIFNGEETTSQPRQRKAGRGEQIFQEHCAGCHAVSNETIAGPPLAGVVGRKIGSVESYPYSEALTRAGGVWTKTRLIDFLSNPQKNFAGTEMEQVDLSPEQSQLVVRYLSESH